MNDSYEFKDQKSKNVYPDVIFNDLKINEEYKSQALKTIQDLVKGNKCDPASIKLEQFEGTQLLFAAENTLTILKKVTEKKVAGKLSGPVKVENEQGAREAIHREYMKLHEDKDMQRQIKNILTEREDKGFALDNNIIPLPFFHKEFVVFEPCHTCRTTGSVKCLPCDGKGLDRCPRCNGTGTDYCGHCGGSQMVMGPNNQKIQCPVCHGNGRVSCPHCNQTGTVRCSICRSKGITACPNCNGNRWTSVVYIMEIEMRTNFDYPQKRIPDRVTQIIEKKGKELFEDAEITVLDFEKTVVNIDDHHKVEKSEEDEKRKDCCIPVLYKVDLPYSHAEYNIAGNDYYVFLFGKQAKFLHVSPFLDDLIKNGKRKLMDAIEGRGDVAENLKKAAEYKTVRQAILYSANYSLNKAHALLKKKNHIGLSAGCAKELIKYSDTALKMITKKPRIIGMAIAIILIALLVPGYIFSPIRTMITSLMPAEIVADIISFAVIFYLSILTVQLAAQSAITKAMAQIIPQHTKKTAPPKIGNITYILLAVTIITAIMTMEISRHMSTPLVQWYAFLF